MTGSSGAERRKERRYQVEMHGELRFDGKAVPVQIADLSASGALLMMQDPPPAGSVVDLWIDDFGVVEVEVVHSGKTFCGLALANPAADRDDLLEWLRQETGEGASENAAHP
jgi:hypothetical protein